MNLRKLFVLCFFVFVVCSIWALPPDIQADKYLLSAIKCMESNDFSTANTWFEKILGMGIKVSDEFHFYYGKSLIKSSNFTQGIESVEKYLTIAGKGGKHYESSLEILTEAEELVKSPGLDFLACLSAESDKRESIVKGNDKVSYSDSHTGKTFKVCGKEWQVGKYNIDWNETQEWIVGLGDGWRTPTHADLKELHTAVGETSEISSPFVWAEKKEPLGAWAFGFFNGENYSFARDGRQCNYRAVAVR